MTDENSTSDNDKLDQAAELVTELIAPAIPAKTRGLLYVIAATVAGACGAATAAIVPVAVADGSATWAIVTSVVGVVGGLAGAAAGALARANVTPDAVVTTDTTGSKGTTP